MQRFGVLLPAIVCAMYGRQPTPVDTTVAELEIRALPPRALERQVPTGVSDLKRKSMRPSSGTRYSHRGALAGFLSFAFGVPQVRLRGPDWIFTSWYEIYVETKQPVGDVRAVLHDILREQFRLDIREDKVPTRALVLRTPRGEPQLARSKHPTCTVDDGDLGTAMVATGTPAGAPSASATVFFRGCRMADLALALSSRLFTPVIDEASAAGRYDFAIRIGGLFAFRPEATTADLEGWSRDAAKSAAEDARRILGAELESERRDIFSLLVFSATPVHGTLHIRSNP